MLNRIEPTSNAFKQYTYTGTLYKHAFLIKSKTISDLSGNFCLIAGAGSAALVLWGYSALSAGAIKC